MGYLTNLTCSCGNTHRTHGGMVDTKGNFTCEDCVKKHREWERKSELQRAEEFMDGLNMLQGLGILPKSIKT